MHRANSSTRSSSERGSAVPAADLRDPSTDATPASPSSLDPQPVTPPSNDPTTSTAATTTRMALPPAPGPSRRGSK
ncbi:hypothetical protein [Actinokineospora diospyrosa]|uniref:Uncharacterized protein n=1 Tax=Actinokineospora diospyrosa TaxID=103728 RepID=A0ABT1IFN2_9PSEU|nr:hypothetical protein [Actinokineospora diospyrosa]MCP2271449.1 hypothetical protein [Actinokineospora diospyrosa]